MGRRMIIKWIQNFRKRTLESCGTNVSIGKNSRIFGHVNVGNNVVLGYGSYLVSARAKINIHDNVVLGPNVTIYTGDHPMNVIGKHISEITENDKVGAEWDKDVVIESGCWIGTRAIILKGVTIGKGSVVGAGAVVTKDIAPYSIYVGVPKVKVLKRFTEEQIAEHENLLKGRNVFADSFFGGIFKISPNKNGIGCVVMC